MNLLRLALFLSSLLAAAAASAQTPIALAESFAGNVNFTGTQKTIRLGSNQTNPCGVAGVNTDVTATLSGIPAGAVVKRATLYWAGSGATPDYSVQMERVNIDADATRRYTATANGRSYFAAAADVTAQVSARGNNTYRFRRLSVDTNATFCQVEGVTGGFALLVVYSNPSEPFRVLNIYEGFQPTHYSSVTLNLSNFRIPDPLGSSVTGRIGHITWEGDATIGNTNAENLFFNNVELYDSLSPRYNQFNSSSNVNGDAASWGIDFDAYTVSSPTIQGGQTTASTRYQSGQDLVLLQSEIVAVPNVPVSDLGIAMTVGNAVMTHNVANFYRITVSNYGPNPEPGPVVVTDSIAPDLRIDSVTGTGWTCTVNAQLVTCTSSSSLASGAALNPITIAVTPIVAPGTISNDAVVTGQNFDNVTANNTANVVTGGAAGAYVFTDRPCVSGIALTSASQTCNVYPFGTHIAGTEIPNIYITALNTSGVPTRLHSSQARTVNFYFGLSCVNPATTAGVVPVFTARSPMTACAAGAANKPSGTRDTPVVFPGGSPSSQLGYSLTYQDVGMVELYLVDENLKAASSGAMVFKPARMALTNIAGTDSPNTANPAPTTATGAKFVAAGAPFSLTISSLSSTGAVTPNFGRETIAERFDLKVAAAVDSATGAAYTDMLLVPEITGSFGTITNGTASGNAFVWQEVGILSVTPGIASGNYLGRGDVAGTAVNIGRFYPDHFDTATDEPLATCPAAMGCPAGVGAAYSGQPFEVDVTARSATGAETLNYRGKFARDVTLTAWDAPGSVATANPPAAPAGSALSNPGIPASTFAGTSTAGKPTYTFPNPYSSATAASSRAMDWVAPTTIYLRATETADPTVTSRRATGSAEGGVRIVAGRLQVGNTYGSELLPVPVTLQAQYWTGGAATGRWEASSTDGASVVTPVASNLDFSACTGSFAAACSLTPASAAPLTLAAGRTVLRFAAPGAGRNGSVVVRVNTPGWLPSTAGKSVFGIKKTPIDYIREVY